MEFVSVKENGKMEILMSRKMEKVRITFTDSVRHLWLTIVVTRTKHDAYITAPSGVKNHDFGVAYLSPETLAQSPDFKT